MVELATGAAKAEGDGKSSSFKRRVSQSKMEKLFLRLGRFFWYWGPVIGWASAIFYFSHQPTLPGPEDYWVNFVIKKILHIVEFGVLGWLVYRADIASRRDSCASLGVAFWASVLYAATDEVHQVFEPGREATLRDFLIDGVGIFLALVVIRNQPRHQILRGR